MCRTGRALLVYTVPGEQRLGFKVHGHDWVPTDFDGVTLMMRPVPEGTKSRASARVGWSNAAKRRRFANRTKSADGIGGGGSLVNENDGLDL